MRPIDLLLYLQIEYLCERSRVHSPTPGAPATIYSHCRFLLNVSQFAYWIEILANLRMAFPIRDQFTLTLNTRACKYTSVYCQCSPSVRIVYCVDPVYIYSIYSVETQNVLLTISMPFALITTTLIAIYWYERSMSHLKDTISSDTVGTRSLPLTSSVLRFFHGPTNLFSLASPSRLWSSPSYLPCCACLRVRDSAGTFTHAPPFYTHHSPLTTLAGLGFAMTIITAGAAFVVNLAVTIYFMIIGKSIYLQVKGSPLEKVCDCLSVNAACVIQGANSTDNEDHSRLCGHTCVALLGPRPVSHPCGIVDALGTYHQSNYHSARAHQRHHRLLIN